MLIAIVVKAIQMENLEFINFLIKTMDTKELKRAIIKLEFLEDLEDTLRASCYKAEERKKENILCGTEINDYLDYIYNNHVGEKIKNEIDFTKLHIKELIK
jgi:hypothetical protein